tara:strand:+ start:200 stop:592 length:393 start_codon:yes stop_codon:yes gene_type:complete
MAHEFCMNCGHKIDYSLKKPNFCPQCGNGMNEASNASVVNEVAEVADSVSPPSEPRVNNGPWLSKGLEYSVNVNTSSRVTMADLIREAQANPDATPSQINRPEPPPSDDDALQKAMDECLPSRESEDLGG